MSATKVFGGRIRLNGKQVRAIIACTSQQNAAKAFGITLGEVRTYWSITANPVELQAAKSRYGTPLVDLLSAAGPASGKYTYFAEAKATPQAPSAAKKEGQP